MDPIGLGWVVERINWLIGRFAAREDSRIESRKQAIDSLLEALTETRIHFGSVRDNGRDRIREETLSRLWMKASRAVEEFDSDLANRCATKGTYWADPVGWSDDELLDARITLEEVEDSLRQLRTRLK